jgi:large subunit ribosomal protein L29
MALPNIEEVRNLNDEELTAEILNVKQELFRLRLEKATRQLKTPHLFKHKKHRLAQLLTVERERQIALSSSGSAQTEPSADSPEEAGTS